MHGCILFEHVLRNLLRYYIPYQIKLVSYPLMCLTPQKCNFVSWEVNPHREYVRKKELKKLKWLATHVLHMLVLLCFIVNLNFWDSIGYPAASEYTMQIYTILETTVQYRQQNPKETWKMETVDSRKKEFHINYLPQIALHCLILVSSQEYKWSYYHPSSID